MDAVTLAGGLGTRLRPFAEAIPESRQATEHKYRVWYNLA